MDELFRGIGEWPGDAIKGGVNKHIGGKKFII